MRWVERILDRKVKLSESDALAAKWTTCAVGEASQDFPNVVAMDVDVLGRPRPVGKRLNSLGMAFCIRTLILKAAA